MNALSPMSFGQRAALALAAVATSGTLTASMLTLFDNASPSLWLAPSPDVLEAVSRCDQLRERLPREMCLRRVVASHGARAQQQLAALSAPAER